MSKKNCTRCGETFDPYNDGGTFINPLSITAVDMYALKNAANDADYSNGSLCPSCAEDYAEFMENDNE